MRRLLLGVVLSFAAVFGVHAQTMQISGTVQDTTGASVAGYSAYFTQLNRPMQDEVIARTEHRI